MNLQCPPTGHESWEHPSTAVGGHKSPNFAMSTHFGLPVIPCRDKPANSLDLPILSTEGSLRDASHFLPPIVAPSAAMLGGALPPRPPGNPPAQVPPRELPAAGRRRFAHQGERPDHLWSAPWYLKFAVLGILALIAVCFFICLVLLVNVHCSWAEKEHQAKVSEVQVARSIAYGWPSKDCGVRPPVAQFHCSYKH